MPLARLCLCATLPVLLLGSCGRDDPGPLHAEGAQRIEADLRFLADDLLEGRHTGSRGHALAARYLASRFRALGLAPGGEQGGYFQTVPLLRAVRERDGARLELIRGGRIQALAFGTEFLPGLVFDRGEFAVAAEAVFVGQAVYAPEFGIDHFADLDLHGKIAAVLAGAPSNLPNDPRAFYSSTREKLHALAERGAVGVLFLADPEREQRAPWERTSANWVRPGMRLRGPDGQPLDVFPTLRASASLSLAATRRLLAGAAVDADGVFAQMASNTLRGFALPGTVLLAGRSRIEPQDSLNVIARLPGREPDLADQPVVYSAHLDHLGVGAEVGGDGIYNGALDNALGVSILLETARLAAQAGHRPRRPQWFAATTGEEQGQLGAEHLATHPPEGARPAANINIDMPILLWPQEDVVPIGIEHSTLAPAVEAAAAELGMRLASDPLPEEVVFIRSDQYAFIRQGVPAVYLKGGLAPAQGEFAGRALEFLRTHYHQPSDQADLPIDYPSAERLARLNQAIGARIAEDREPPRWNPGDFFGERFGSVRRDFSH